MVLEEGAAYQDGKALSFKLGGGRGCGEEGDPVRGEGPVRGVGEPSLLEAGDVGGVGV